MAAETKHWRDRASQRAIAAAEAWSQAAAEGRVQSCKGGDRREQSDKFALIRDPREVFAKAFGVNEKYVEMARALWLDDPPAADAVKAGTADHGPKPGVKPAPLPRGVAPGALIVLRVGLPPIPALSRGPTARQ
jgi:hypothetical protein